MKPFYRIVKATLCRGFVFCNGFKSVKKLMSLALHSKDSPTWNGYWSKAVGLNIHSARYPQECLIFKKNVKKKFKRSQDNSPFHSGVLIGFLLLLFETLYFWFELDENNSGAKFQVLLRQPEITLYTNLLLPILKRTKNWSTTDRSLCFTGRASFYTSPPCIPNPNAFSYLYYRLPAC